MEHKMGLLRTITNEYRIYKHAKELQRKVFITKEGDEYIAWIQFDPTMVPQILGKYKTEQEMRVGISKECIRISSQFYQTFPKWPF